MALKDKIVEALRRSLEPEHIQLSDDDGVWGIVVSSKFRRIPALERQKIIEKALRDSAPRLTKAELRHVLAIAALTPAEYAEHDPD